RSASYLPFTTSLRLRRCRIQLRKKTAGRRRRRGSRYFGGILCNIRGFCPYCKSRRRSRLRRFRCTAETARQTFGFFQQFCWQSGRCEIAAFGNKEKTAVKCFAGEAFRKLCFGFGLAMSRKNAKA